MDEEKNQAEKTAENDIEKQGFSEPSAPKKMPEGEKKTDDPRIFSRLIEDEMKQSYLDYSMSVIIGRALPDVRDGLKPVHRRILFAMNDMGVAFNKPFRKSARIVGEVLGKFHPHGDTAVYDALVRMAQDFSLRYPLIKGQGNFGSIDGDRAAAMRYTEAKLAKISSEMLTDIDKDTINFEDNFDGSLKEPTVLPSKMPNLLINGSSGIAVGMATNIPPHNILEVCDSAIKVIDDPEITERDMVDVLPGPDFPTGGTIVGKNGIRSAYLTGHGKVKVRGKTHIEEKKKKNYLIIDEIPYMVNKTTLIEEIADCVRGKTIEGVSDIRDESDRNGMRIVIILKRDVNNDVLLNQLHKHTRLQTTFGINMLALSEGKPKVMNLKEIMVNFVKHRRVVVVRRTRFELKKAEERAHILEGLIIALDNIDKAIALIKKSKSAQVAREGLMSNFKLTEIQSQAILDMKLQKLTGLEQDKIREEQKKLMKLILELKEILASEAKIMGIIKDELIEVKEKYADERRTDILDVEDEDIDYEDLIDEEDVVVTISHSGYIKRTSLTEYKEQRRGGKGIIATTTKDDDFVEHLFIANTHSYILFFTDDGKVHWLKVYKIPDSGRYSVGKFIVNLLDLPKERKITAYIKIKEFDEEHYLIMATKNGVVKKTNLIAYSRPRAGGIRAINLDEGDSLVNVVMTDGEKKILLATKFGRAVKFKEIDARPIGRTSRGVRGIRLRKGDSVVSMVIPEEDRTILTITENGYGKRTRVDDYRLINRGGKGVINIVCSDRNGHVVDVKSVEDEDQMMFISKNGIVIRTSANGISVIGRNTQGMRLMKMNKGDTVVAAAKVIVSDEPEVEEQEDEETDDKKPADDKEEPVEKTQVKKEAEKTVDEEEEEKVVEPIIDDGKESDDEKSVEDEKKPVIKENEEEAEVSVEKEGGLEVKEVEEAPEKAVKYRTRKTMDADSGIIKTIREPIVDDEDEESKKKEKKPKKGAPDQDKIDAAREQLKAMGIDDVMPKD